MKLTDDIDADLETERTAKDSNDKKRKTVYAEKV